MAARANDRAKHLYSTPPLPPRASTLTPPANYTRFLLLSRSARRRRPPVVAPKGTDPAAESLYYASDRPGLSAGLSGRQVVKSILVRPAPVDPAAGAGKEGGDGDGVSLFPMGYFVEVTPRPSAVDDDDASGDDGGGDEEVGGQGEDRARSDEDDEEDEDDTGMIYLGSLSGGITR